MSHTENKVEWCLRKAEKELNEGKKHRGLIKTEKNLEKSKEHIKKAEHNLSAAIYFNAGNFSDVRKINCTFQGANSCEQLLDFSEHPENPTNKLHLLRYGKQKGFLDWSISAFFYCIYHCFLSIISKFGYESGNQECTIALVSYLKEQGKIDLDDKFINALEYYNEEERHETSVIEKREFYTYGTTISANEKEINESIELCKECINKTKEIIFKEENERGLHET